MRGEQENESEIFPPGFPFASPAALPPQDQFICQSGLQVETRPHWRPALACQLL